MDELSELRRKRCAIYTRKSAQPPLGQEITSLESQRAICSAYIASQQHKGWVELKKAYDDAGRSGSTLVRPALQELITDIETGFVDVVVVYKMDRITRTLLDFVRLIDLFDKYGVVFVAITQNFDTGDSMGRLIRNILLTFAQFEREIASDRMRDKKMVMKQRGLWTGGTPPLGYDLRRGKLLINPAESEAIRCIFDTYIECKSISAVHRRLQKDGHKRKVWKTRAGVKLGGGPISLTSLHHILANPIYMGDVSSRGERYPGIHQPIIEAATWDRAQEVLKEREQFKPRRSEHILAGLLFDSSGRRMNGRIVCAAGGDHRYYLSAVVNWGVQQKLRPSRVAADQVERLILASLASLLSDRRRLREALMGAGLIGPRLDRLCERGSAAAVRLDRLSLQQLGPILKALFYRIEVQSDHLRVIVRSEALAAFVAWDGVGLLRVDGLELGRTSRLFVTTIAAAVDRERSRVCVAFEQQKVMGRHRSQSLIELLEDARIAQKMMYDHRDVSMSDMAWSLGRKPASFARLVRLNYLAPDIVTAIIDGAQPAELTRRDLLACDLPMDWDLQRRMLGFPPGPGHARPEDQLVALNQWNLPTLPANYCRPAS